ncbi:MAG: hypothetical protein JXB14_04505, partial [Candidatus Altiarchaeota archaeon]|nr:hypothetical protein [Candidatus Altiarchaeota archaeon]
DYVIISQLADERITPAAWFQAGIGQVVKVVDVGFNGFRIYPPLRDNINPDSKPKVMRPDFIYNSGVEDLTILFANASLSRYEYIGTVFTLSYATNSWIRNVQARNAYANFVDVGNSAKISIVDSHFKRVQKPTYTNTYALGLGGKTSDSLITNNILEDVWVTGIFSGSANGNVYSYNYEKDIREDHGIFHHGTYPFENLIEGNDAYRITHDCWWGRQGPGITYFRNRASEVRTSMNGACESEGLVADRLNVIANTARYFLSYPWCSYPDNCFDFDRMNTNMWVEKNRYRVKFIGIATPESTNTFIDNVKGETAPAEWANFDMPASLYLTSAPDFWCKETPWPAIGSNIDDFNNLNKLPAQRRYEGLQCTPIENDICIHSSDCVDQNPCTYDLCKDSACISNNANLDGGVNIGLGDIVQVIANWATAGPTGDLDSNGNVGLSDIIAVISLWANTC